MLIKIGSHGEYLDDSNNRSVWWTELLLELAYDMVKYRKYPILIPSYNNPNPPAVRGFLSSMNERFNHEIILFVRDSQKKEYEESNSHPYVRVVSMRDDLIDSAGKARKESLKWLYNNGYDHAFSFDDDALAIGVTRKGFTKKGDPKSEAIRDIDSISKTLALWQLAMENLECKFDNLMLTGVYPIAFSWKPEYCWIDQSALLYRGNLNQVVCLNVKNIIDNGINYRDNRDCGHEDIDLILQGLDKDMLVATFPFIWYSTPPMDIANFSEFGSTLKDRFKKQQELMINNWNDCPYVSFKEKRGLAQVVPNFRRYRKDKEISEYVINAWNDKIEV